MPQERELTLVEQAIEALERTSPYMPTPVQVQQYLKERHDVDMPLEQVAGNMQIVYSLREKGQHDDTNH